MQYLQPIKEDNMQTEYTAFTKQIVDFQKMALNNWFNAAALVQDQAIATVNTFVEHNAWLPAQSRDAIQAWTDISKQEQLRLKSFVDQSVSNVAQCMGGKAPQSKAKPKKATA